MRTKWDSKRLSKHPLNTDYPDPIHCECVVARIATRAWRIPPPLCIARIVLGALSCGWFLLFWIMRGHPGGSHTTIPPPMECASWKSGGHHDSSCLDVLKSFSDTIAASRTIAKLWRQPKSPVADEWIKQILNTHTHTHLYIQWMVGEIKRFKRYKLIY